jgi:hypothetical protein
MGLGAGGTPLHDVESMLSIECNDIFLSSKI